MGERFKPDLMGVWEGEEDKERRSQQQRKERFILGSYGQGEEEGGSLGAGDQRTTTLSQMRGEKLWVDRGRLDLSQRENQGKRWETLTALG